MTVRGVVTAEPGRLGTPPLFAIRRRDGRHRRAAPVGRHAAGSGTARRRDRPLADPYGQLEIRPACERHRVEGTGSLPVAGRPPCVGPRRGDRRPPRPPHRVPSLAKPSQGDERRHHASSSRRPTGTQVRVAADARAASPSASFVVGATYRFTGIAGQRATRKGALDGYRIWLRDARATSPLAEPSPAPTRRPAPLRRRRRSRSRGTTPAAHRSSAIATRALRTTDRDVAIEATVTAPAPACSTRPGGGSSSRTPRGAIEVLLAKDAPRPASARGVRATGRGRQRLRGAAASRRHRRAPRAGQPRPRRSRPRPPRPTPTPGGWSRSAAASTTSRSSATAGARRSSSASHDGRRRRPAGCRDPDHARSSRAAIADVIGHRPARLPERIRPRADDPASFGRRHPADRRRGHRRRPAAGTGPTRLVSRTTRPRRRRRRADVAARRRAPTPTWSTSTPLVGRPSASAGSSSSLRADGFTLDDGTAIGTIVLDRRRRDSLAAHRAGRRDERDRAGRATTRRWAGGRRRRPDGRRPRSAPDGAASGDPCTEPRLRCRRRRRMTSGRPPSSTRRAARCRCGLAGLLVIAVAFGGHDRPASTARSEAPRCPRGRSSGGPDRGSRRASGRRAGGDTARQRRPDGRPSVAERASRTHESCVAVLDARRSAGLSSPEFRASEARYVSEGGVLPNADTRVETPRDRRIAIPEGERQYHIGLGPGDLAEYILLPGDQDRTARIASRFDSIELEHRHREFASATGMYRGQRVSVVSTGIGTDNVEIVVAEILAITERPTFIRVGSCGALQPEMASGRPRHHHRRGPPRVDDELVRPRRLSRGRRLRGGRGAHRGGGAARSPLPRRGDGDGAGVLRCAGAPIPQLPIRYPDLAEDMARQRVMNFEMEASALLVLASLAGCRAGVVCAVYANRTTGEFVGGAIEGRRRGGLRRDRPGEPARPGRDGRAEARRIDGPLAAVAVDRPSAHRVSGCGTKVPVTLGPTRRSPDG